MAEIYPSTVLNIFTCPDKGLEMQAYSEIRAFAGVGLENDRYALGKGAFSKAKRQTIRHVSLVATEAIQEANEELLIPFTAAETRRNIITEGVDLNQLVAVEFSVGEVAMRGVELCTPCGRPSKLTGKPDFQYAFEERGGLRAEILSSGLIQIGDSIRSPFSLVMPLEVSTIA